MKRFKKKIELKKITIARLNSIQLSYLAGGGPPIKTGPQTVQDPTMPAGTSQTIPATMQTGGSQNSFGPGCEFIPQTGK
jgi:hypothetical protein